MQLLFFLSSLSIRLTYKKISTCRQIPKRKRKAKKRENILFCVQAMEASRKSIVKIALEKEEEEEDEGKSLQLTLLAAVSTTACPSSSSPRAHRSLKSQAMNKFFSEEEERGMWEEGEWSVERRRRRSKTHDLGGSHLLPRGLLCAWESSSSFPESSLNS